MADALSTAFYLLGPDAAGDYTARHPDVGVIIVEAGQEAGRPQLRVFGLSDQDFTAATNTVN
jgi:thiamine biosynthesis lipoprotein